MTRIARLPLRGRDRRSVWRRGLARKFLAAALLGTAVYAVSSALAPPSPDPGPLILVAGADLPVGTKLTAASVQAVHVPEDLVPSGALTGPGQAEGLSTTAPLREGEILTDLRVSPQGPLEGLDEDLVLAHLPLSVPDLASTLRPGLRVDILTTTDGSVLATDVLLVQRVSGSEAAGGVGYLVAVTPEQAGALAVAGRSNAPGAGLTVVLRRSSTGEQ